MITAASTQHTMSRAVLSGRQWATESPGGNLALVIYAGMGLWVVNYVDMEMRIGLLAGTRLYWSILAGTVC